jgi:hypothetical protein
VSNLNHYSEICFMKTKTLFLLVLVVTASCKKENFDIEDLFPQYQPICDVWKPLSMSYDSMGVRVTTPIQYDKLVINDNLSYVIYYDQSDYVVEDGDVRIITQTDDELEIKFAAVYPATSSFAGSHLFCSDVVLESLTDDEMILTKSKCWLFQNVEFYFEKY